LGGDLERLRKLELLRQSVGDAISRTAIEHGLYIERFESRQQDVLDDIGV
jgi:hypothetical protein